MSQENADSGIPEAQEPKVLIIGRSEYNILQCADFLNKKNVQTVGVSTIPEAVKKASVLRPTHAFISINLGSAKVDELRATLNTTFGTICYVFLETPSRLASTELKASTAQHKMNVNISGGGLHRIVEGWAKEQRQKNSAAKKNKPDLKAEFAALTGSTGATEETAKKAAKKAWWDKDEATIKSEAAADEASAIEADKSKTPKWYEQEEATATGHEIESQSTSENPSEPKTHKKLRIQEEEEDDFGSVQKPKTEEPLDFSKVEKKVSLREKTKNKTELPETAEVLSDLFVEDDPNPIAKKSKRHKVKETTNSTLTKAKLKEEIPKVIGKVNVVDDEEIAEAGSTYDPGDDEEKTDGSLGSVKVAGDRKSKETGSVRTTPAAEKKIGSVRSDKEEDLDYGNLKGVDDEEGSPSKVEVAPDEISLSELEVTPEETQAFGGVANLSPPPENSGFTGANIGFASLSFPGFTGYAVFLTDLTTPVSAAKVDELAKRFLPELKSRFEKQGRNFSKDTVPKIKVLDILTEIDIFLPLLIDENPSAFKLVEGIDEPPIIDASAEPNMLAVEFERIDPGFRLSFDLFIRLDLNAKYVKYVVKNRPLSEVQKEKLKSKGITKVHIRASEKQDFETYCRHAFIFQNLKKAS